MLPQSYGISRGLYLNNFLQVWLIGNQRDQVPLFRYINWDDDVYNLVIGRKLLGSMKYLMRSLKRAAEAVGSWTAENWDVKRVNSICTMVSGRFVLKKKYDSLSWSSIVRDLYTRRGYIIGELNEEPEQAWQAQNKNRYTPLFP